MKNNSNIQSEYTSTLREMFQFLMESKKFWLIPIVIILLLAGFLLVFAQSSSLAPFIYTFF